MQYFCELCDSRFFGSEEDLIEGHPVCSYCEPKVVSCEVCHKLTLYKRIPKFDTVVCAACAPNGFKGWGTPYQIKRFMTFRRDGFSCRYCGRSPINDFTVELECDHIVPKSKGGKDELSNFVTACKDCNQGKLAFSLTENERNRVADRPAVEESICTHLGRAESYVA
jgi:hypothetical protein